MKKNIQPYSVETVKSDVPEHNWEKYYQLKEGDVFVEVGAFWGRYALIAAKKKCSQIILIEPSPVNIVTISNLVIREGLKNVTIVSKAITSTEYNKTLMFSTHGNPAGHELLYIRDIDYTFIPTTEIIRVETDTLDNILFELDVDHVDLLASDCEGSEINLILGSKKYINKRKIINVAIGAYHHKDNPDIVSKMLKNKGYLDVLYDDLVVYGHL